MQTRDRAREALLGLGVARDWERYLAELQQ
jgi:hypothetical protein